MRPGQVYYCETAYDVKKNVNNITLVFKLKYNGKLSGFACCQGSLALVFVESYVPVTEIRRGGKQFSRDFSGMYKKNI